MPQISESLYHALMERLEGDALADLLGAEVRAGARANAAPDHAIIRVPLRLVSHVASAMSVGSVTSMMCDESVEAQRFQNQVSKDLRAMLPEAFDIFLHRSDRSEIVTLLSEGAKPVLNEDGWGPKRHRVLFRTAKGERSFMLSREGEAKMGDRAFAESVIAQLEEFARLAAPDQDRPEPEKEDGPEP